VLSGVLAANIELHRRLGTWDREVDVLVAVSKFGVDRHVAGGVPREKIVVKDNFAPDPGSRDTAPSSSASVLFVGRPTPEKGLNLLIDAWRSARPEGLSLEVIGATGVPVERADESIRFLGEIPSAEVRERMLSARALTLPSQWPEGQPLVMIEALAAGLPVTGTRIGGIEEVLSEDLEASCVPLGDLAGWRAALLELRDDAAVDRRGASARTLYDRRFTPQVALDRLLNVYELATARSASRR
jgi:glycosyltransferase involved in cell wall biosynthesis